MAGSEDRPIPSSTGVSERMSRARRRDTAAEMLIRRESHRRGLRYRVHVPVPGLPRRRADIVFPRARVMVFVDGCFWHSCPEHATVPHANHAWWVAKLQRNVERDRHTDEHLAALGWTVLRFWEHHEPHQAVDRIEHAVRGTAGTRVAPGRRCLNDTHDMGVRDTRTSPTSPEPLRRG